jgi:hypothetical protein
VAREHPRGDGVGRRLDVDLDAEVARGRRGDRADTTDRNAGEDATQLVPREEAGEVRHGARAGERDEVGLAIAGEDRDGLGGLRGHYYPACRLSLQGTNVRFP